MKFADLKTKPAEELREMLAKAEKELRALRGRARLNQLKEAHQVGITKKTIARIKMILNA